MKQTLHHMFAVRQINFKMMLSLIAVFMGLSPANSRAEGYTYSKIASRGDTAPGGSQFNFGFEPGQINDRGDLVYVADLAPSGDEGVFLFNDRKTAALALPGHSAPGGGTFDGLGLTPTGINDEGDAAFAAALTPPNPVPGMNAGLYRYSADKKTLSAVVVPRVTTVPLAGTLQGVHYGTSINNRGEIC